MQKYVVLLSLVCCIYAQDCVLTVPPNPLTAEGLATPYTVTGCNQADPAMASFVQGAIIDIMTGQISIYNPLVVTAGVAPAVVPTAPVIPAGAVIGLWFGTNGNTLTLTGNTQAGNCVNGGPDGSIFTQFAYCNAAQFFSAANQAIKNGQLVIPPLGTAVDGKPCPTVRDYFLVDMDSSDNVNTEYLAIGNQTAQNTLANRNKFPANTRITLTNGSDNRLLAIALDTAVQCTPFKAPDLADNGALITALPLNELHAATWQQTPIALVTLNHAMARVNNQPNLLKVNAYRAGVNQVPAVTVKDADSFQFCFDYYHVLPQRLQNNENVLTNFPSPDQAAANSLFAFLAARFNNSFGPLGMGCQSLLGVGAVVTLTKNGDVTVGAAINPPATTTTTTNNVNTPLIIGVVVGGTVGLVLLIVGIVALRYYVKGRQGQYL